MLVHCDRPEGGGLRATVTPSATCQSTVTPAVPSAPVVAGVYHRAMAPVGVLMAVVGYVIGIYAGLTCAWLLSQVALHLL